MRTVRHVVVKETRIRPALVWLGVVAAAGCLVLGAAVTAQVSSDAPPTALEELARRTTSTMSNPYRLVEHWPTLPDDMTRARPSASFPTTKAARG